MMEKLVLVQKAISKVFGDFVAKVVSDGVDVLKSAIKDADLDRKSYNENPQTRLYQLIVDALNRFTYNKYKKQDKLYDAAESIIKGYIRTQDNVDAVKSGLKMLASDVNIDTCQEFLETLCGEICRDDNSDLYKEIDMLWKRRESEYIRGEFAKIGQNDREILEQLNDLKEVLDFINRNMNRQEGDKAEHNGIPIVNRADEYAERWNENVFLNNFNEEDENAGINIELREIYVEECLPHYIWKNNTKTSDKLRNLLTKYIINNNNRKMLLILGQPGIGKSTLITWIMANLVENEEQILVYQFASDLSKVNWQSDNILDNIFKIIGYSYRELEGKTLIIDGFDEIQINGDRERILHKLNQELKKKNILKKFSFIITCRENYVNKVEIEEIEYITLQAWDEEQIRSFCEIYEEVIRRKDRELIVNINSEIKKNKIIRKKNIMGIPLILYMVLALNVDIEKSSSTVDIYDQIFSLKKGGIYDRDYDVEHRINNPQIKKHIHNISQQIAFWMFENNAEKAIISQKNFGKICENEIGKLEQNNEGIQKDVLIGNFFQLKHCEGKETDELQFVHRSIYEYFVVVYFFESMHNLTSKEEIAGKLGELLKDGKLSRQICEFIMCKFEKFNLSYFIKEVFNIMLRDGMTYHIKTDIPYNNIVERELNIFSNMLKVVHLWNFDFGGLDDRIAVYLRLNREKGLYLKGLRFNNTNFIFNKLIEVDLSGAFLKEVNLNEVDLSGAFLKEVNLNDANLVGINLSGACLKGAYLNRVILEDANLSGVNLYGADLDSAYLSGVDLRVADLRGTNLSRVDLRKANLSGADLRKANLSGANLYETIYDEHQVNLLCKKYDLTYSRVYIFKTQKIISYKEYCLRGQRT